MIGKWGFIVLKEMISFSGEGYLFMIYLGKCK